MNRLKEIEERLSAIKVELDVEGADIEALDTEADSLIEERKAEMQKIETRKATLEKIAQGEGTIVERKEEREMEISAKEKRSAFCKHLLGREMTETEKRALTIASNSAGAVVEETMANDILSKVKSYAPVLNDITLLHVNGAVKFAVEGTNNGASLHTENATINASDDTMVEVVLSAYEITKLIQISASVKNMAIDAFDAWLVDNLAEAIAMKIEALVFGGTGTSQPKGINAITWNATNSISVAKTASITSQNVYDLFALLKGGYARRAKAYCNRKTLFAQLLPLRDSSKNELVTRVGDKYYLLGTVVEITDSLADGEMLVGDMKKYVGNLAQDITVANDFDLTKNAHLFLGCAIFDGKPAIEEAFVKMVKSST